MSAFSAFLVYADFCSIWKERYLNETKKIHISEVFNPRFRIHKRVFQMSQCLNSVFLKNRYGVVWTTLPWMEFLRLVKLTGVWPAANRKSSVLSLEREDTSVSLIPLNLRTNRQRQRWTHIHSRWYFSLSSWPLVVIFHSVTGEPAGLGCTLHLNCCFFKKAAHQGTITETQGCKILQLPSWPPTLRL